MLIMRTSIRAVLSVGLLPFAHAALAQGVSQPDYIKGDIAAFHGNPDSLSNAIHKAEKATGGRVVEIRFAKTDGMPGFSMVVAKGKRIKFWRVVEQSGSLNQIDALNLPDWILNWRQKSDLHFDKGAKVSLSDAIRTAEQSDENAPAIAAGIARSASNPTNEVNAYNVLIDRDGMLKRVAVDISTGEVIADPRALTP